MQHNLLEKMRFSLKYNTKADFAQPASRDPPAGNGNGNDDGHGDTSGPPSQRAQGSHTPCGAVHPPHSVFYIKPSGHKNWALGSLGGPGKPGGCLGTPTIDSEAQDF